MASNNLLIYVISGLMFSTGAIYFYEALSEAQDFNVELAAQVETMFFATAGILYLPFGMWMVKSRMASRAPYAISLVGSVMLITLYVASRIVNLPIVGQQEDVGVTDLASKVLQAGIIALSGIVLARSRQLQIPEI